MVAAGITPRRRRRAPLNAVALAVFWGVIGVSAFLLLAKSVQNSGEFARLQWWIVVLNACGALALTVLVAHKIWRLVHDYRRHVPGSRLTARTVAIFGALVIAPLLIVYFS